MLQGIVPKRSVTACISSTGTLAPYVHVYGRINGGTIMLKASNMTPNSSELYSTSQIVEESGSHDVREFSLMA